MMFRTFCLWPPSMESRLLYLMSVRKEFFRPAFSFCLSKSLTDLLYSSSMSPEALPWLINFVKTISRLLFNVHLVSLVAGSHHLSQLVEPEPLVVDLVGGLLQVLHVVGQHQVPQGQEVAVILR